jgi:hypothetical protein
MHRRFGILAVGGALACGLVLASVAQGAPPAGAGAFVLTATGPDGTWTR